MSLLIKNTDIITMDPEDNQYKDGCIAVDDEYIVYSGDIGGLPENFRASRVVDGSGKVALPGLVNAHTHTAMSLFRGHANDLPLWEWLSNHMWPLEDRLMPGDAY